MRSQWMCAALMVVVLAFAIPHQSDARTPLSLCKMTGFYCQKVKRGQSWQSLWPNERERGVVMRINRMNTQLYPGLRLVVPENIESTNLLDFAPFPRQIDPPGEKLVVFNPRVYAWGAYDPDGMLIRWGPASGGSHWCDDVGDACHTVSGKFRFYSLGGSNCVSTKFPLPDGGAPMPYCMYFYEGFALHGSPNGLPGFTHASHGCVRLFVPDAEWLRYDFIEPAVPSNHYRGTKIVVGPYG